MQIHELKVSVETFGRAGSRSRAGTARSRFLPSSLALVTIASWLITSVLGWVLVRAIDANPLRAQGVGMPLAVGVIGLLALTALAWRTQGSWVFGLAAGSYAGWASMNVAAALNGTPFGYGGLGGDASRISAMVMHFSTTLHPTDPSDPSQPVEYPPLYPMVLGRIAAWTGKPGWSLLGESQMVLIGLVVVVAFLLWAPLVHPSIALALAVVFVAAKPEPAKAYEALALVILVPWLLTTFSPPPGRRPLNPLIAGIVGGLTVVWYPSVLMATILGVAALLCYGWRTSANRAHYLRHAAITIGVAFIVASWYIVPLVVAYSGDIEVVSDLYLSAELVADPLQLVPFSADVFGLLRILGVVGVVFLLRRAWWAPPLALIIVGTQLLRAVLYLRFVESGHASILYYSYWVVEYLTVIAGVLVAARLVAWVATRAAEQGAPHIAIRQTVTVAIVLFVALVGTRAWEIWAPAPHGMLDGFAYSTPFIPTAHELGATYAHAQPLPNGDPVRFSAPTEFLDAPYNADAVAAAIRETLGPDADPVVLSDDARIFSYQPWQNILPADRTSTSALLQWDRRHAALSQLGQIAEPAEFFEASAALEWGAIDVFVLRAADESWFATRLEFSPVQFADPRFAITKLANNIVVIVRKP